MMKKMISPLVVAAIALIMGSCTSYKKIAYFQNADEVDYSQIRHFYDAKIVPKDLLTISVSTTDPEASKPFSLHQNTSNNYNYGYNQGLYSYLVNNDGNINFPVIGYIHVAGLTIDQCQNLIRDRIKPYMAEQENPIVTVRMSNFNITVLGEVGSPGIRTAANEKMSIVDAIAMSGDMSIYGQRDNILLIRENEHGQKETHRLNMNDANIMNSPYYYLQQNDIIYVEPNSVKKTSSSIGSSTSLWMSLVGVLMSATSIVVNIVK